MAAQPDTPNNSSQRRHGRGWNYTPAQAAGRLKHLEKIGRRCDGSDRTCLTNAATREMTLAKYDAAGAEIERLVVRSCGRHRKSWTNYFGWTVIGFRMLIDQPDPDTGLMVWGCYIAQD